MFFVNRILFVSLLTLFCSTIHAASKLFPGYIITKTGDTVLCSIDYGDWYKNPETIEVEIKNEKKTFVAGDIQGFGVPGYADYTSSTVSYHINPTEGTELPEKFMDSTVTRTVFLKVVVNGPYRLYELDLAQRKNYFLQKDKGVVNELVYRVSNKEGEIKEDRQYVNFLAGIFLEEEMLDRYKRKIYAAVYGSDISSLVNILNEKHGVVKVTKRDAGHFQMDLFGGGVAHFFSGEPEGQFPTYGKIGSSTSFSGGVNFQYVTGGRFGGLKLGLSIAYDHYAGTGHQTDSVADVRDLNAWYIETVAENLSVTNTMIVGNFYAAYTLNPSSRVQFYLKAGLSMGVGKKNVYLVNDWTSHTVGFNSGVPISENGQGSEKLASLVGGLPNFNMGAGIESGRHKLEALYYFPAHASAEESQNFKIGMAGIYYYFTVLK
ncbi:hypothetical protein [Puia sp.]|jgi:hypothetical protein|uniref:hypothetical protein n=1 Tax=Puia sp. TaxID=2045100 RepID=UPI002F402797